MENTFKDKKVLVFGLGLNQGGVGVAKFFAGAGAKVKVTDLKNKEELQPSLDELQRFPDIEYTLGEHKNEDIDWADLIIKNPAIKPDNQYIEYAKERGKQVEMEMGIFLQFVQPSQIIGVTGTKGKSTTASLIYEALNANLGGVILAGNIGKSVLDTIPHIQPETLVVLELSSFQLEAFDQHHTSPKWAVITNIYPDHLNYYRTIDEYVESKRAIAKYQSAGDFLFLKKGDTVINNPKFLKDLPGKITYFSPADLPADFSLKLPGSHNLENAAAVLSVCQSLQIPRELALKTMAEFRGVEFRLQLIKEWRGIRFYNDTAATNPDAAIQALQSLPNSILITGGVNKNLPYKELARAINKYAKAVFFLEGTATDAILEELRTTGHQSPDKIQGIYNDLGKILRDIKDIIKREDVILLSPGAASFNLFKNEFDRGRKFNEAVEKVFG